MTHNANRLNYKEVFSRKREGRQVQNGMAESRHTSNIKYLIEKYGEEHGAQIAATYNEIRENIEQKSKIKTYLPIFVLRETEEILHKKINPA